MTDPDEPGPDDSLPTTEALVDSVARFIRGDIVAMADGRDLFLARVAANSLDIARRELRLGPAARSSEHARLRELLDGTGDLTELRDRLGDALRDETMALDAPGLAHHLRSTTADQANIDQPDYPGLTTALTHRR